MIRSVGVHCRECLRIRVLSHALCLNARFFGFVFKQGIVTAPVLFALKEFPEMSKLIQRKFKTTTDRNQVLVFPFSVLR
jgi:hypothetical protein